ncbi:unnamed protein product [Leuciscus chuanchicus]
MGRVGEELKVTEVKGQGGSVFERRPCSAKGNQRHRDSREDSSSLPLLQPHPEQCPQNRTDTSDLLPADDDPDRRVTWIRFSFPCREASVCACARARNPPSLL